MGFELSDETSSKAVQKNAPSQEQEHLQALSVLLKSQGLSAEDLLQAITALAVVKQQENNGRKEGENKIFQEKVLLFSHDEGSDIRAFPLMPQIAAA
jgi:hypothetical protein